jgi:hypothetical protein
MGLSSPGKKTKENIKFKTFEIPNIKHMPHIESFDKFIQPLLIFSREIVSKVKIAK